MKTTVKFERLYYGMRVYSISDEAGHTAELPAGTEPDEASLEGLLVTDWGSETDRALVGCRLLELVKEAKTAEITAYDESEAVNSFELDGLRMWLPFEMRQKIAERLPTEKNAGRTTTTLWYGTIPFQLPVTLAETLLDKIKLYAADCFDVTASHKAAVEAMTDIDAVRAYDYTTGYPERPVINTDM